MQNADLLERVQDLVKARIISCSRVDGGYTPATRLTCETTSGLFFVKAGSTPLTSKFLRREIEVYQSISGDFMPKLIAWEDHEVEPVLILEDLSHAYWPPPWPPQHIDAVLKQIEAMHSMKSTLQPYSEVHDANAGGWHAVAEDPQPFLSLGIGDSQWLKQVLPILRTGESMCRIDGESLVHWDLRSDNMCFADERVVFVDWNHACVGNPKLDLGFWLPSLHYEGGPAPQEILPDAPEIAAWVSGFFASRAGLPQIPDAPYVRTVQMQQLSTALPWAIQALGLPSP